MGKLLSPDLDCTNYLHILKAFWSLYQPMEEQLRAFEDWPIWGLDLSPRWKTPKLESDLAILGVNSTELSPYSAVPPCESLAAAWGSLYVLEGSTLGAQIICRILGKSKLPLEAQQFFTSYGLQTQAMWQSFAAALTTWSEQTGDVAPTFTAARATFQAFAACFSAAEQV